MEFEFNFGQQTINSGLQKNTKKYASVNGSALPLSQEELVFMNKSTGENHVMTHQVLQALSLCQEFKSIDKHVLNISQNIPELSNQVQAIEKVVEFLINKKLLIEDKEWIKEISSASDKNEIESSGIVIRSCDRPKQLHRLLQSLVKYQNKFSVKFPVQIYDDSSSEKNEKELEKICDEFSKEININFYGSTWQQQFIKMLKVEFHTSHYLIDWLLSTNKDVFSAGRTWNFALLNNAGKKFLFFDDDYIFESRVSKKEKNLLNFSEDVDLNVGFALGLSDIRESSESFDQDVLTQMIKSCGKTIGNWISESEIEFSSIENKNLLELQRINQNSVIKSTGNGTWGSPRSNSNYWLYSLEGEQKEEFWKSREVYLDNIEASNLLHYSENYEAQSLTKFSPSAIDNSTLSPFAMPTNRVEDHFFNAVSLFCYPDQISLHFPFMMGHIQTSKRDRSSQNHIAIRPNFNKFLADYSLTLLGLTDAQDPELRLKTLAKYVMGLANSSDFIIRNRLKEYLSQMQSNMVLSLQMQMAKSPDAPVYWQADIREIIEANGKAVLKNDIPILEGWDKSMTESECIKKARLELQTAAEAMELWPDLWKFCQIKK